MVRISNLYIKQETILAILLRKWVITVMKNKKKKNWKIFHFQRKIWKTTRSHLGRVSEIKVSFRLNKYWTGQVVFRKVFMYRIDFVIFIYTDSVIIFGIINSDFQVIKFYRYYIYWGFLCCLSCLKNPIY